MSLGVHRGQDRPLDPAGRRDLSRAAARRWLALIGLVAVAVYLVPCWWGLPMGSASWAYDEIVPARVTGAWNLYYPPTHRHLLRATFEVVDLFADGVARQIGWPSRDVYLLASRVLSVVMATLTLLLVYRGGRVLADRLTSLLAVGCFAFGLTWVFYAKTSNLDVPYVFWFALSLVFFLRCLQTRRWYFYLLFAAFGALSITTKPQAFGLYVLSPLVLVHDLRSVRGARMRPFWRALLDRRILEAAGVALVVALVTFGAPWGSGELGAHLARVRSFQHFELAGGAALMPYVATSLRSLSFAMGLPVLLAALAGLGMSLYLPSRDPGKVRLLQLLLFILPYYALFIVPTGFNWDRHYFPFAIVLSLFAARTLAALWRAKGKLILVGRTLVGVVLAVGLGRAVSVDLLMLGDARYETERWIASQDPQKRILGLGDRQVLPRNLQTVGVNEFATRRTGEHGHNPMVWHNCVVLDRLDAELLVTGEPMLAGPGVNYRELVRHRNRSRLNLVDWSGKGYTNISKVARGMIVYERTEDDCVDAGLLPRALDELRYQPDPERRERVADYVLQAKAESARTLAWSTTRGARLDPQWWTWGTQPAAIAMKNDWFEPVTPQLELSLVATQDADLPLTAFVEDGKTTHEVVFTGNGRRVLDFSPMAPGARQLLIVWTDKAFRTAGGRSRGVRALPIRQPDVFERTTETLPKLSGRDQRDRRDSFAQAVLDGVIEPSVAFSDDIVLVATWWDGWTVGTTPAGLVVRNPERHAVYPRLRVSCDPLAREVGLTIDDGDETTTHALDCDGVANIRLGKLRPRRQRLYVLRSDYATTPTTGKDRVRGVHIDRVVGKVKSDQSGAASAGT